MKTIIYIYLILLLMFPIVHKIFNNHIYIPVKASDSRTNKSLLNLDIINTDASDNFRSIKLIQENTYETLSHEQDTTSNTNLSYSNYPGKIMIFY